MKKETNWLNRAFQIAKQTLASGPPWARGQSSVVFNDLSKTNPNKKDSEAGYGFERFRPRLIEVKPDGTKVFRVEAY